MQQPLEDAKLVQQPYTPTPQPSLNTLQSDYVVNVQDGTEIARLINQDFLLTRNMKGAFAERTDFSAFHSILDLACGPGGWVLEMAYQHADMEVIGVDIDKGLVEYARAFARTQRLENASFAVMNIQQPLDFPDNTFDVVNARYLYGFMAPNDWPRLIQECQRILRPGGILRLTEPEWPISTSLACDILTELFTKSLFRAGKSFSPSGRHVCITPKLGYFLRQAGFQHIDSLAHILDYSIGTPEYNSYSENLLLAFQLLEPFFLKWGETTPEQLHEYYRQAQEEILANDFCGICFYMTIWGEKP